MFVYLIPYVTSALQPPHSQPFGGTSFRVLQMKHSPFNFNRTIISFFTRQMREFLFTHVTGMYYIYILISDDRAVSHSE